MDQATFARSLLGRLGIRPTPGAIKALVGWQNAEGGNWHNDAHYNPLNTTQSAPGAGNTGTQGNIKQYRSWQQGLEATAQTLQNGRYGGILQALKAGNPQAVASAIDKSPWGTHGALVYNTISSASGGSVKGPTIGAGGLGTPGKPGTPASRAPGAVIPGFTRESITLKPQTSFDDAGFSSANRRFLLGRMIGNPNSLLFKSGVLRSQAPSPVDFTTTRDVPVTTKTKIPGITIPGPMSPGTPAIPGSPGGMSPAGMPKGAATFEGKPVAAWIKPALVYARHHGWKGTVSSGLRSFADQTRIYNSGIRPAAKPGTSNHEGADFPRGAVDVTDAPVLSTILQRSRYRKLLQWAGSKDPVHFSHPHGGSY